MPNLYEVLGLSVGAEPGQVKAAFHKLAKGSHPDVNADDATAEKRFREFNQAYEILNDPERRAAYDLGLEHQRAEGQRRVWNAMAATAASFMMTVGCGVYFLLPDAGSQFVWHHEPTVLTKNYSRPAPQPEPDSLRQRAVGSAEAGSPPLDVGVQGQTVITLSTAIVEGGASLEAKTVLAVAPTLSAPDRQAQHERALRLHAKGMEQIERGNVSGARMFFSLAAEAGLVQSMRALAGTYDATQLAKLKVLGMQPDVDAAQKWYQKARDLGAIAAVNRAAGEEGADKPTTDLTQFRAAYTSGDGLAYVVIRDEKGEHIYRYGNESRLAAKKDTQSYMLFSCNTPLAFRPEKADDNAALLRATVVRPGDPRFSDLDAKYLSGCSNPLVKSAIPRS